MRSAFKLGTLLPLSRSQASTTSSLDRRSRRAKTPDESKYATRVVHIEVDKAPLALSIRLGLIWLCCGEGRRRRLLLLEVLVPLPAGIHTSMQNLPQHHVGTIPVRSVQEQGKEQGVAFGRSNCMVSGLVTARLLGVERRVTVPRSTLASSPTQYTDSVIATGTKSHFAGNFVHPHDICIWRQFTYYLYGSGGLVSRHEHLRSLQGPSRRWNPLYPTDIEFSTQRQSLYIMCLETSCPSTLLPGSCWASPSFVSYLCIHFTPRRTPHHKIK